MADALLQSYLWRAVELAEATADMVHRGRWMPALILARTIIESVGAFNHFCIALGEVMKSKDLNEIEALIRDRAFATRLAWLVDSADTDLVKATNILTQVDALDRIVDDIRADYDHLSEYAHPNSLGTFLFFGKMEEGTTAVSFCAGGFYPDDYFKLVGKVCSTLRVSLDNANSVEKHAEAMLDLPIP